MALMTIKDIIANKEDKNKEDAHKKKKFRDGTKERKTRNILKMAKTNNDFSRKTVAASFIRRFFVLSKSMACG